MLLAQHFYSPVHAAARVLALKEANCPALPARGKELHWWPLEGGGLGEMKLGIVNNEAKDLRLRDKAQMYLSR